MALAGLLDGLERAGEGVADGVRPLERAGLATVVMQTLKQKRRSSYDLQDLPDRESAETIIHLFPGRSLVLSIRGMNPRFAARIVLWEDTTGLHAACLDINARPLKRRARKL